MVSYLGHIGLSEKGTSCVGWPTQLFLYLCSWQCVYSRSLSAQSFSCV